MRALLAVVGLLLAAGCTPASDPADPSVPRGSSAQTLTVDGAERTYRLYVPAALSLSAPVPLVVMIHGGFGSGKQAEEAYGWDSRADHDGFVVAYPDGLNRAWAVGGGCCGEPGRDGTDDVGFIEAMLDAIAGRLPVSPGRVYATGISNGGMLSYRLACESTRFAAVAPVAATLLGACPTPAPLSVLHIHGLADRNVPFDGSRGSGYAQIDGLAVPSTVDTFRSGCSPAVTSTAGPVTTARSACPAGREVVLVTVAGAGHQWPGSAGKPVLEKVLELDPPSTALDATATIWTFFAAHPGT